jgi:hypothetical protein
MRFIQALKGTQVVQGVLLALQGLWRFYVCAPLVGFRVRARVTVRVRVSSPQP